MLFFGTPHQGTDEVTWSQIISAVAGSNRNDLIIKDLDESSQSLQRQLTQYNNISGDFETKFFYETYAPVAGENPVSLEEFMGRKSYLVKLTP